MARRRTRIASPDNAMAKQLDLAAEFEKFRELMPDRLKKDLLDGMSAKQLYKKYAALAAARTIAISLSEADSAKALAASKEVMDQAEGKVTTRTEITHKMGDVADEQLDALIKSKLAAEGAAQTDDDDGEFLQ